MYGNSRNDSRKRNWGTFNDFYSDNASGSNQSFGFGRSTNAVRGGGSVHNAGIKRRPTSEANRSEEDNPPYSRLFIIGHPSLTQENYKNAFEQFGTIERVYIASSNKRDSGGSGRNARQNSICYIKFALSSEAAHAVEEMNGRIIDPSPKPIRVLFASPQGSSETREEEEHIMKRLFIKVPSNYTEKMLEMEFSEFGNIEYCRITCDDAGRSKGYGYVKFYRSYHGALALEGCNQEVFRPVFAAPKPQRGASMSSSSTNVTSSLDMAPNFNGIGGQNFGIGGGGGSGNMGWNNGSIHGPIFEHPHNGQNRLEVAIEGSIPPLYFKQLINLTPGVSDFYLDDNTSVAHVTYSHPAYAAFAQERLHSFEFLGIFRLLARFPNFIGSNFDQNGMFGGGPLGGGSVGGGSGIEALSRLREASATLSGGLSSDDHIAKLADAIKHASSVIERYQQRGGESGSKLDHCMQQLPEVRCSVDLPPVQPLADPAAPIVERCFLVCVERALPQRVLENVFCRFGGLISVGLLQNKNHGFANYSTSIAAETARRTLHLQYVDGVRIKVIEAEPMRENRRGGGGAMEQ